MAGDRDALLRALPAVTARIVAVSSTRDAFVGASLAERSRVLLALRPDLELRTLEGSGHWSIYEAPEQTSAMLLDALSRGESRPSGRRSAGSARAGDGGRS